MADTRPPGYSDIDVSGVPGTGVDYYNNQLAAMRVELGKLQRYKAHEEGQAKSYYTGNNAETRAAAAARAGLWTAEISKLNERIATIQNKQYEASGQYDKLLAGSERDAYMALTSMFKSYNLGTLADKIFDFVKKGYGADTISIMLQDTKEYKDRFVGNEERKKQGLPVLSPREYLDTEAAYKQIMQSAGLPKGFYDNQNDFADLIGKNVSPTEIQKRVDLAVEATQNAPEAYRTALKQVMGLSEGDMVAAFLDEDKALPLLNKATATARIGAEALQQGLLFDKGYAEGLAQAGITVDQARQGYAQISNEMQTLQTLGSIYGEDWTQRQAEKATFQSEQGAVTQKRTLASRERAQFSGSAGGAARGGLAGYGGAR